MTSPCSSQSKDSNEPGLADQLPLYAAQQPLIVRPIRLRENFSRTIKEASRPQVLPMLDSNSKPVPSGRHGTVRVSDASHCRVFCAHGRFMSLGVKWTQAFRRSPYTRSQPVVSHRGESRSTATELKRFKGLRMAPNRGEKQLGSW